nr:immunoglobulin heavy chain junction region [Mus musculus]
CARDDPSWYFDVW